MRIAYLDSTLNGKPATSTTLSVSSAPHYQGAPTTLTAQVTGNSPSGTVSFFSGSAVVDTAPVDGSGIASVATSKLLLGASTVSAVYNGDNNNGLSSSTPTNITVLSPQSVTTTGLAVSSNAVYTGVPFTINVSVISNGGASAPTGNVQFIANNVVLGTSGINAGGTVSYTYTPTVANTYAVSATYVGDAANLASSSSAQSVVVTTNPNPPTPSGCLPAGAGALICAPTAASTVASPITITTGAVAQTGNIASIRAYVDNIAVFTVANPTATKSFQLSQAATVGAGTHKLVIVAYQSTGGNVQASETFTVGETTAPPPPPPPPPTGCTAPASGLTICTPAKGATISSPVQISAAGTAASGNLTALRVYVDNVSQATVNNPKATKSFSMNLPVAIPKGKHNLVIVGYQSTGGSVSLGETVTVQ